MEAIAYQQKENVAQWKQMWSLTALYGSIIIGWIAYEQYQPKLLVQFNFTQYAFLLTVAQAIICIVTPPIAGKIGDRYRAEQGHRIPIITTGISLASMVFMAVAVTLLTNPGEILKWVLPVLIVFWLISMSIFTSPALSTIETFLPAEKLPLAMAILTLVSNLLYSLEPIIIDIIDILGAPVTFITGGVLVFLSGYALKKNSMDLFTRNGGKEVSESHNSSQQTEYEMIFLYGAITGLVTTTLFNILPDSLAANLSSMFLGATAKSVLVTVLVVSGVMAVPFTSVINRIGLAKSFWISTLLSAASMLMLFLISSSVITVGLLLIFTVGFAILSVCSLPLAFEKSSVSQKVLGAGIFFGGMALPDGIVNILTSL